jgi:hypothetical protein
MNQFFDERLWATEKTSTYHSSKWWSDRSDKQGGEVLMRENGIDRASELMPIPHQTPKLLTSSRSWRVSGSYG